MSDLVDIASMTKERRGRMGVRECADAIGIGHATVSRIERGKSADSNTLAKVYRWLGLTVVPAARITELEAEVERLKASRAWQPIETAPKDGAAIIGAFHAIRWADSHRKHDIVRCWFQPEFDAFISSCRLMEMAPGYTIDGKARQLHSPVIQPVTHWMPLPAPPEKDARHD